MLNSTFASVFFNVLYRFVLMQAVSWCLFSLAILVGAWSMRNTVMLEGTWTLTGTLGFLSELIMVISIQFYLPANETVQASPGSMQAWVFNASMLGKRARRFLVTVLLFNVFFAPVMVLVSMIIPFLFASPWVWGSVFTLVFAVYLPTFFLTSPHKTGAMESSKLRTSFLVEDVIKYFNGRLVKTADVDPTKQYIFGYHPHGVLPIAAMWATNSPSWNLFQTHARGTVTLIASHLFGIPVTREFLAAAGAREVSRVSFNHALTQGKSVVLVPGGMKEMRESLSTMDDIVVCRSHKGFIKMAISHGVDLVPMFSFGETKLLDCAFPELQKFCWKNLGIPFPLFVGRWNLPVPRPQQVTILVGPAIEVEKNAEPSEEYIDSIADKYFTALHEMFEKHKVECGHPNSKLIFK
jgi:1-acyl-sn-glycerol-3-phosphate acyltransferase